MFTIHRFRLLHASREVELKPGRDVLMQQISLENLVQYVSPHWLHLLKVQERSHFIVLRNGIQTVNETDVAEIMEAVIQEHAKETLYH